MEDFNDMSREQLIKALGITYKHIDELAGEEVSRSLRQLTVDWVTTGKEGG
jgi:hypothetical protein